MDKKLLTSVFVVVLFIGAFLFINKNNKQNAMDNNGGIEIIPIEHATMVLKWAGKVIYVDPVGGASSFMGQSAPDMILLTHDHSDHFDVKTLQALSKDKTLIVAPMKVADLVPNIVAGTLLVAKNGQHTVQQGFKIEIIPAYNLPNSEKDFHPKGEYNGYVLEANNKRVYISGDTADTPEIKSLKNIDIAFVSMNLPYTMSVESAADAVLIFKPKKVYPYHYRTPSGFSDVAKFKKLVNEKDGKIEVVQLNWYPK
ncbi:MAG: MBL fold metallo-hydrolase [Candidatus Staskawiczbacteria bacterium]|nr:MBL fold metallo-hydrolase [Candidatus Staskawiczbacteria bacterium]